jgi:ABC-type phosphate transport system substrate-binding protein
MTITRSAPLAALVAALWFGFQAAPAAAQGAHASDALALRGAGSTFASLLYKKWIEAYRKAAPTVSISYDPVGSGEGIARFMAETVDFRQRRAAKRTRNCQGPQRGGDDADVGWYDRARLQRARLVG